MADRLIDAVHEMRAVVSSACGRVQSVAMLLEEVGMEKLADRLFDAVEGLSVSSKRLNDAYGDKLNEDLKHSQAMAGNMLMLALKTATEKAGG